MYHRRTSSRKSLLIKLIIIRVGVIEMYMLGLSGDSLVRLWIPAREFGVMSDLCHVGLMACRALVQSTPNRAYQLVPIPIEIYLMYVLCLYPQKIFLCLYQPANLYLTTKQFCALTRVLLWGRPNSAVAECRVVSHSILNFKVILQQHLRCGVSD